MIFIGIKINRLAITATANPATTVSRPNGNVAIKNAIMKRTDCGAKPIQTRCVKAKYATKAKENTTPNGLQATEFA